MLKHFKVPDDYASNISLCITVKDRKSGLKGHVLKQQLLLRAVRGSLSDKVNVSGYRYLSTF